MSNTLYLECYSGISGDMSVAALLDLGADKNVLEKVLNSLNIDGFKIEITRVKKSGIDLCDFNVILDNEHENHDHDMDYLYGKNEKNNYNHSHSHEHRGLSEIINIINNSDMTENAKKIALNIFYIIAEAESKAHGLPKEKVHFHEVGAIDSIVDVVSIAVCVDNLNIKNVIIPEIYEGQGFINCQHGEMPIPVPAVINIMKDYNLKMHITNIKGELITPTGAAIAAAIITSNKLPENFLIEKIGMGAGKRNYEKPSILRAMLIKDENKNEDYIYKLETNIDDCNGEILGFVMEKLFDKGALDVNYIPIFMKKNRPSYQLNIICNKNDITNLEKIIFEETTTIGIRKIKMKRTIFQREIKTIFTSLGQVKVKICKLDNLIKVYPEYNSIIEICRNCNLPYQEVYNIIQNEYKKLEDI